MRNNEDTTEMTDYTVIIIISTCFINPVKERSVLIPCESVNHKRGDAMTQSAHSSARSRS